MKSHEIKALGRTPAESRIVTLILADSEALATNHAVCPTLKKFEKLYNAKTESEIVGMLSSIDKDELRTHATTCDQCKPYIEARNQQQLEAESQDAMRSALTWIGGFAAIGLLKKLF
jgi:hypothetical protein